MDNKFDKAFEDQGWKDMQLLLDKEMPQKKKRRLPFLFMFLGMGAIALVALFLWPSFGNTELQNPNSISIDNTLVQNTEIQPTESEVITASKTTDKITKENQKQSSDTKIKEGNEAKSPNPISTKTTTASTERTAHLPRAKEKKISTANSIQSKPSLNWIEFRNSQTIESKLKETSEQNVFKANPPKFIIKDAPKFHSPLSIKFRSLDISQNLIHIDPRSFDWKMQRPQLPASPVISVAKEDCCNTDKIWNLSLGLAGSTNLNFDAYGPGLQLRSSFKVLPKLKIEIGSGIYLHLLKNQFDSNELMGGATNDGSGTFEVYDSNISNAYANAVKNEFAFTNNIGIQYCLSKKFSLAAGIKTRTILNRSFNEVRLEEDIQFSPMRIEELFTDSFTSIYLGLEYHLNQRFKMRLESDFTKDAYLKAFDGTHEFKKGAFLQLEMHYSIR